MKKLNIYLLIVVMVFTAILAPILPVSPAYAAGGIEYEAESAIGVDTNMQATVVGAVYSGTGYVDVGDQSHAASLTWSQVQAAIAGNYVIQIKYSNNTVNDKPVSLWVNGHKYATFRGESTGSQATPTWKLFTAVGMLNQGANVIKLAAESGDGPEIDAMEVIPYATLIEAENGGGAAHSDVTIAANVGTAPGFSGTGYLSIAAPKNGYMLYNNAVVPSTGKYTIKVRYSLGNTARPYAVTINGVRVKDAVGASTGAWSNWKYEELTGIDLNAGANTLKIERIGANSTPVIDRFEIQSESVIEVGDQSFRHTSFELSDVDAVIAATPTNGVLNSPLISGTLLKPTSVNTAKIVENAQTRWAEITTAATKLGIIGFPFHSSWLPPVPMKSFTLESTFMLPDEQANYIFKLVSAGGLESSIFAFGMDGKLYARSNSSAGGALAMRSNWSTNTRYTVKLVFHLDTNSYDMFLNGNSLVTSEPLQTDAYSGGLKGFYMEVKDGARQETKILVDDIKLSGSNTAGTPPRINANPGALFVEQPYIGTPENYYVSPTGLDTNDGLTTGSAFKTINKAASATNPGDTVNIMPGTYSPINDANDFVLINRSGAVDVKTGTLHPITYKAYDPNNKPKLLLPPNVKGVWDMVQISANYIVLDGIEVEGTNLTLTLAEGEANYESKVAGGSDWSRYALTNTNGVSVSGHHITVRNSDIHHMSGAGLGGGGDYITFEYNKIHSNSWYSFYATSGISFMHDFDVDNNTTDYKIIVRNNEVYDNQTNVKWETTKGYSDGNGIIFDVDEGYNGKKLVINNLVYDNGGGGIHAYRSNNVHVINNTIYKNSRSPYLKYPNMDAQSSDNSVFVNNISIAREEEGEYANLNSGWNNLFANNIYGGNVRFLGQNDRVIDPKFVSVTGATYDFHLQADSPAIDNGARSYAPAFDNDGNVRPYAGIGANGRVDIGAFETSYKSATPLIDDSIQFVPAPPDVIQEAKASKGTPVIDGQIEDSWLTAGSFQALKVSDPTKVSPLASMRLLWDEHNLYVLAEVKDANLNASGGNLWEHDSMEFFVDENNGDTIAFQSDDRHYRINYKNLKSAGKNTTINSFTSAAREVEGGYLIEAAFPLNVITGSVGTVIGFDAGASDDSNYDGIRDNATMWSNQRFNSHVSTQWYGNITFVEAENLPTNPNSNSNQNSTSNSTAGGNATPVFDGATVRLTPILTGTAAKSELSLVQFQQLLARAQVDDKGRKLSTIHVNPISGAQAYVQILPAESFKQGKADNYLAIQTGLATLTIPDNAFKAQDMKDASQVGISVAVADISSLPKKLKEKIGNKPVLELSVLMNGTPIAWKNNQSPITVTMDYQPTPEERNNADHIAIWYIDGQGKVIKLPSGKYDVATGKITFMTTHFSQFAIGYEIKSFEDLASYNWAKDNIEVLVSKGIIEGKSDVSFAPSEFITRADFVSLLVRALSLEADVVSNFDDVKATDYFVNEVGIAKALGITEGKTNHAFKPTELITRQDMMVLTARAFKIAGITIHGDVKDDLGSFEDADHVALYAATSVADLVKAGIVQGSGKLLNPTNATTRAETAVLIYRLYTKLAEMKG
ncbi:sugar-binding protein [Paenibacillus qinlingensis]|uniref:sugar-binding protein n=1 Tax=Paenibacillus qinlingensis TaxID=1837343 RepID=UPI001FE72F01|nr:sugar-binding protein [Paenibacillus qinlingensis]